jgi:HSP20 family protein
MALVRSEPWGILNQLHREMDGVFNRAMRGEESPVTDWVPAFDIKEDTEGYVLYADLPGVDPSDIDVNMENGVLTVRGERKLESEEERAQFKRVERVRGSFYRRFSLPDTADSERIAAKCVNGVLEVRIPKHAKVQPRRITVEG